MAVEVRVASPKDAADLARVNRRSILEICAKDYPGVDLSAWVENKTPENFRKWEGDSDKTVVTGLLDGKIHGVGLLKHDGWIKLCYVSPEALGKGLGKAILQFMETEAKTKGIKTIKLESTITAKDFYLRNGYKQGPKESCSACPGIKAFPMEKTLTKEPGQNPGRGNGQ
ncbi:MAG: GNAT family N-acetyltransferase [Elusimicrobia bacterium]|nr:GNAT family N-acetyltransferase [Elusimicrobiota bacterium]